MWRAAPFGDLSGLITGRVGPSFGLDFLPLFWRWNEPCKKFWQNWATISWRVPPHGRDRHV